MYTNILTIVYYSIRLPYVYSFTKTFFTKVSKFCFVSDVKVPLSLDAILVIENSLFTKRQNSIDDIVRCELLVVMELDISGKRSTCFVFFFADFVSSRNVLLHTFAR